ncbi:MAG: hypothetical protein WBZ48_01960 [Bacteroidota bacterium]
MNILVCIVMCRNCPEGIPLWENPSIESFPPAHLTISINDAKTACAVSSELVAVRVGAMRALRKRLACVEGLCAPFSPGCVWKSIASIPIPRSSLCFFLWRQRKKGNFEMMIQSESAPPLFTFTFPEKIAILLLKTYENGRNFFIFCR